MKRLSICLLIVWLWMMRPADAQTRTLGWTSVVVGGALIAASFNYKRDCDGYRSRYEGGFSEGYRVYDYCTTLTDRTATTKDTPWDISLARPALLYSGIAALTGEFSWRRSGLMRPWPSHRCGAAFTSERRSGSSS